MTHAHVALVKNTKNAAAHKRYFRHFDYKEPKNSKNCQNGAGLVVICVYRILRRFSLAKYSWTQTLKPIPATTKV